MCQIIMVDANSSLISSGMDKNYYPNEIQQTNYIELVGQQERSN